MDICWWQTRYNFGMGCFHRKTYNDWNVSYKRIYSHHPLCYFFFGLSLVMCALYICVPYISPVFCWLFCSWYYSLCCHLHRYLFYILLYVPFPVLVLCLKLSVLFTDNNLRPCKLNYMPDSWTSNLFIVEIPHVFGLLITYFDIVMVWAVSFVFESWDFFFMSNSSTQAGSQPITSLSWLPVLRLLVTLSKDGSVQVWKTRVVVNPNRPPMQANFFEPAG